MFIIVGRIFGKGRKARTFWISLGYKEFLLLVHGKGIYWIGIVRNLGSKFVVCFCCLVG